MATAEAGTRSYYLDEHADEVVPCDCTIEGWAAWLASGGDPVTSWAVDVPANGTHFNGSATLWQPDIVATWDGDDWQLSRGPEDSGADFCAVRFGEGLGWDAEAIVGASADEIVDFLVENAEDAQVGQREFIATGKHEDGWLFIYRAGPPARLEAEHMQ